MSRTERSGRPSWRARLVPVLGLPPVTGVFRRVTRARLRILAYHGIPDPGVFARQLDEVIVGYRPVSGREVSAALAGHRPLPAEAVWLTFDDGRADVVEHGLPLLRERGIPATLFVCPGLVVGGGRPWWGEIEDAVRGGWGDGGRTAAELIREMKRMPDGERRTLVEQARRFGAGAGSGERRATASERQLREWLTAGFEIGNHTWDHPCLDRAPAAEQRTQILEADRWLQGLGAFSGARLFAYPDGAWTPVAEQVLGELGYGAALLFDHRLASTHGGSALRLSRLRLDTNAPVPRARTVVSGVHSALFNHSRRGELPPAGDGVLRVLAVIEGLGTGGAEVSLAELAPGLALRGIQLEVAYLFERSGVRERLQQAGIPLHLVRAGGRLGRVARLVRLMRQRRPDLVHTTLFEADICGRTAAFLTRVPSSSAIVSEMYGPRQVRVSPRPWRLRLAFAADKATCALAGRFHAVSCAVAATMAPRLGIPPDRVDVVYRSRSLAGLGRFSPDRRARARAGLGLEEGQLLVLAVGRHEPQKGLDVLVSALRAVLLRQPRAVLAIAGRPGTESGRLEALVATLGLGERVRLLGHRDDVSELLCASDLFAFPSRWEGIGGAVIEAMALGCGIVCSDLPALREVVEAGEDQYPATFVIPDRPDAWAEAVCAALAAPRERAGLADLGRRRIARLFDAGAVCDAMAAFYRRAAR